MSTLSSIDNITHHPSQSSSSLDCFVPPPPPHLELLQLPVGQSGRICIAHVISYLDDASRSSALASCLFLNGAVKEYNTTTAGLSFATAAAAVDKERADSVDVDGNKSGILLAESPRRVSDFPPSGHGDEPETHAPSEKKDTAYGEDDEDKADAELSARPSELEYISVSTDCQVQDHEVVASASNAATSIANQRSILDDMDDMEEGILPNNKSCYSLASSPSPSFHGDTAESYCTSLANTPTPSLGEDEVVVEEQEHKSPLMASSHSFEEEKDVEAFMDDEHDHERHYTAEQENNDDDDLESISTMGTKTQLDVFLSNINSTSGAQTPLSFVSPEEKKVHYDDYANAIDHSSTREEGSVVGDDNGQDDDELLSIVPTFSQGGQLSLSPITPSVTMPSPNPASLIGATRLELGSTNHLGDGSSSLHIFGRVQRQQQQQQQQAEATDSSTMANVGEAESKASSSNSTGELQQVSLEDGDPTINGSIRQPPEMFNPHPKYSPEDANPARDKAKFTRLGELQQNGATPFDEPFDEADMPLVSASMSSISSSYAPSQSNSDSPKHQFTSLQADASVTSDDDTNINGTIYTLDESSLSRAESDDDDEATAPDVLAQFSDAALFGDTPKILSDFMAEIMDSAKDAVSHLSMNGEVRRNRIDDSGPIKIGDKYYSHNEALRLWKKTKVKLEDRHQQVDDNGDIMMERGTFFEKNSVFAEKSPKDELNGSLTRKTKSKSQIREEQGAVSISELIKRCKLKDLQRTRSEGESTAPAGNVGQPEEKETSPDNKKEKLSPPLETVDESNEEKEKTTLSSDIEETPFDVDNETAETEDETKSMDGSRYSIEIDSDSTSHASNTESNLSYSSGNDKNEMVELTNSIQLKRAVAAPTLIDGLEELTAQQEDESQMTRSAAVATPINQVEKPSTERTESDSTPVKSNNIQKSNVEINSTIKTNEQKDDIESVAGRDSLPSHMGVEVNSHRGMNFINGKSSEQVKPTGGKSVCEQSVVGSQYGTEVLFKPKKRVTARKPRTLASHNMGVKSVKQNATKQVNAGGRGTAATKQSRVDVKAVKQGSVKQQGENRGPSSLSKLQGVAASMKTAATPQRKMQKKPSLPLKKLKLGMKKTSKA